MRLIKGILLNSNEYVTLKYDGVGISGEIFVSAMLTDLSGNKTFEMGEYISKPKWDETGDYTGLVAGLLASANLGEKNIVIVGSSKLEAHAELEEFFMELFTNFTNVASITIESRDLISECVNLTLEVINDKKSFYRHFSK
jgi:hypothetical protein